MTWRDRGEMVAAGALGWVVGRVLAFSLLAAVGTGALAFGGGVWPEATSTLVQVVFPLFHASGIVVGVLLWRRHRATVRAVFSPSREVVTVSLGLAALLVGVSALFGDSSFMFQGQLLGPHPLVVVAGIVQFTVFFYPFTALARYLYRRWREFPRRQRRAFLAAMIVLNPVFVVVGGTWAAALQAGNLSEPCGAEIRAVTPGSPGADAGLAAPERITRIGEETINTTRDVLARMERAESGGTVTIHTNTSTYQVQLEEGSTRIGIEIVTAYCSTPP